MNECKKEIHALNKSIFIDRFMLVIMKITSVLMVLWGIAIIVLKHDLKGRSLVDMSFLYKPILKYINPQSYTVYVVIAAGLVIANFDIQKIKNPSIEGTDYQQGEMTDYPISSPSVLSYLYPVIFH